MSVLVKALPEYVPVKELLEFTPIPELNSESAPALEFRPVFVPALGVSQESGPVRVNQQVQDLATTSFHLILLAQDDRLLEAHTADFLELAFRPIILTMI